ncbi:MAG: cyclase family protein [Dehalococcoidales bacterium]
MAPAYNGFTDAMKQHKIYDVSLTIEPAMAVWPGDAPVAVESFSAIAEGGSSNLSLLRMGSHSGTHVDAPRHFIDGAAGVDAISPAVLTGPARLFQLPGIKRIDRGILEGLALDGVSRLLLGTGNSALLGKRPLSMDYAFVSGDAARYLVEKGVKLVGIDYLSIEEHGRAGHPVHHALLGAGVVIVEGLDLAGVPPGDYELMCLPLKLKDADGAPARVFLREI